MRSSFLLSRLSGLLCLLLMSAPVAHAQFAFSAGGGVALPTSEANQIAKTGYSINLQAMYDFPKSNGFSFGVHFTRSVLGQRELGLPTYPVGTTSSMAFSYIYAKGEFAIRASNKVSPLLAIGLGPAFLSRKYNEEVTTESGTGFLLQAGLRIPLSDRFSLDVYYAYNKVFKFGEASKYISKNFGTSDASLALRYLVIHK